MNYNNSIEPRLLEYLKKKMNSKNTENNYINPKVSLEKEYGITYGDMESIQKYLNRIPPKYNISLPNETEEYPVYAPHIQFNNQLHYNRTLSENSKNNLEHNPNNEDIFKYLDDKEEIPVFLSRFIEKKKSKRVYDDSKYPNQCVNKIREQYFNNQKMDTEILYDLQLGMPSHTRKSYGYNNAFENNFQYIDSEMQRPEHIILPFPRGGLNCRLENRKQFSRDIY